MVVTSFISFCLQARRENVLSFLNGETIYLFIILMSVNYCFLTSKVVLLVLVLVLVVPLSQTRDNYCFPHTLFITVVIDALGTMTTPAKTTGLWLTMLQLDILRYISFSNRWHLIFTRSSIHFWFPKNQDLTSQKRTKILCVCVALLYSFILKMVCGKHFVSRYFSSCLQQTETLQVNLWQTLKVIFIIFPNEINAHNSAQ